MTCLAVLGSLLPKDNETRTWYYEMYKFIYKSSAALNNLFPVFCVTLFVIELCGCRYTQPLMSIFGVAKNLARRFHTSQNLNLNDLALLMYYDSYKQNNMKILLLIFR